MSKLPATKYVLLASLMANAWLCNDSGPDARAAQMKALSLRSSTFIELGIEAQSRTQQQWEQLMAEIKASGFDEIIVQWLQYDQHPQDYLSPLRAILAASKKERVRILIGLSGSQDWGTERGLEPSYIRDQYEASAEIATQILPIVRDHPFFVGWYISHEVEAVSMQAADNTALVGFYKQLSRRLKQMTPNHIVALSGFKQSEIPKGFDAAKWWQHLLKSTSINRLYFQDGYGVLRLSPLETSHQLIRELSQRLPSHSIDLWIVIEAFEESGDVRDESRDFTAFPTSIKRLCAQVRQAQSQNLPIALFTFDEYMRGPIHSAAFELGQQWRKTRGCLRPSSDKDSN